MYSIISPYIVGLATIMAVAIVVFGPTLKCLPGMYHVRTLRAIVRWRTNTKSKNYSSLFKPDVFTSRSPLFEIDMNLHKTNSSYFSDLDESRLRLLSRVVPCCFSLRNRAATIALGGTACTFFKAIAPFQEYEVQSQVLCWDDKWLYIASYFLVSGGSRKLASVLDGTHQRDKLSLEHVCKSVVVAAAITKYCFKSNGLAVAPRRLLKSFLPPHMEQHFAERNAEGKRIAASMESLSELRKMAIPRSDAWQVPSETSGLGT